LTLLWPTGWSVPKGLVSFQNELTCKKYPLELLLQQQV
jgi:hypothetical protein